MCNDFFFFLIFNLELKRFIHTISKSDYIILTSGSYLLNFNYNPLQT